MTRQKRERTSDLYRKPQSAIPLGKHSETPSRKSTEGMAIPSALHLEGPLLGTRLWTEEITDSFGRLTDFPTVPLPLSWSRKVTANSGHGLKSTDISNCAFIFTWRASPPEAGTPPSESGGSPAGPASSSSWCTSFLRPYSSCLPGRLYSLSTVKAWGRINTQLLSCTARDAPSIGKNDFVPFQVVITL